MWYDLHVSSETRTQSEIAHQAQRLLPVLQTALTGLFLVEIADCLSQIGSGSLPVERLPSVALTLTPTNGSGSTLQALADRLRTGDVPIIGRIHSGRLWFDLRTLEDDALFIRMMTS